MQRPPKEEPWNYHSVRKYGTFNMKSISVDEVDKDWMGMVVKSKEWKTSDLAELWGVNLYNLQSWARIVSKGHKVQIIGSRPFVTPQDLQVRLLPSLLTTFFITKTINIYIYT